MDDDDDDGVKDDFGLVWCLWYGLFVIRLAEYRLDVRLSAFSVVRIMLL